MPPTDPATKARIQCDYAECLAQVSLFGPGRVALRRDAEAMKSLEQLSTEGMTAEAQQHASTALLALGAVAAVRKQPSQEGDGGGASKLPPPHVMVSYNWDHQAVILRVVASLQGRGYLVWVDTEQMKGATVDTMALAVEGSAVVLVGVSRQYKESSNCRMEAQYALQKKKPLVPLKLVQDYEADGWLGLLLGTSMWYAMYGETLTSEGAFEDRMSAVCRELGARGRADATVPDSSVGLEPEPWIDDGGSEAEASLVAELRGMKLMALRTRAMEATIADALVDDAMESDAPKSALLSLLMKHATAKSGRDESARLRSELAGLKLLELRQRALAEGVGGAEVEDALESDRPKAAVIELLVGNGDKL